MRVEMIPVQLLEPHGFGSFLAVKLDDPHRRNPFLQERVDSRQPGADLTVRFANSGAKEMGCECHERNYEMRHDRESPVHHEHRAADCDEREYVPEP